jgi:tRNA(fMet)-specific endonuclease VapC
VALLDTTVLIDLGRGPRAAAHRRVRTAVRELLSSGEMLFTSRINEAEFRVGPEMSAHRSQELERIERVLSGIVILEFTAEAAQRYAAIKAVSFRSGLPMGDCDAMIASVALTHGQMLITRNSRHFEGLPGLVVRSY